MRLSSLTALATVLVLGRHAALGAMVNDFADIQYWVGSGPNRAALVIDWQDSKYLPGDTVGQSLAWGYRWENGQSPTGLDMITAIAAADVRLEIKLVSRGTEGTSVFGMFYDLDADGGTATFDPDGESGFPSDTDDHFAEGWFINGYWSYYRGSVNGSTQPGWTYGTNGAQRRTLVDGAWDGWSFDDYDVTGSPLPLLAAVALPEPGTALLLALGGFILWRRR